MSAKRPLLRLRDVLPKGLYWRTLLIIVAPAALLQLIITVIFLDDHWQATSKRMSQGVASDVALIIRLYESNPTPETFAQLQVLAQSPLRLEIELQPNAQLERPRCSPVGSTLDRLFTRALHQALERDVWYDSTCPGTQVIIRVPTVGAILQVRAFRDRVQARSGPLFVAWITGATLFLVIASIIFIRNQVRPIEQLSEAMEKFGRGEDAGHFRVRGAREVRAAALAFFDMRQRIRRHIEQRSQLLAGVSHDLRTPLTRLKLQLALLPPSPEIEDAKRDLAEMQETLDEYLAFAKGIADESPAEVDLVRLTEEVVADAQRSGATIALQSAAPAVTPGRARALRRCLANLIDNAVAHGDQVRVTIGGNEEALSIAVDDNGPGISPDLYEEAFRPFSRLDETRSRNQKGVGLGLAIARDVARSHGGDIVLGQSPMGGLRATLRLPRPA